MDTARTDTTGGRRTVEIAGLGFEAHGSGDVLTGVAGPQPHTECPRSPMPLAGLVRADLPLDRWSPHADRPIFVLDQPVIYVGTTRHGLHTALIGVKETEDGPTALGLLSWTDHDNGVGVLYHWPTRADRPHFSWSFQARNPAECVMTWFPLPAETARVDYTLDGRTIADSVRPVSRVAVVPIPSGAPQHSVNAIAYDSGGAPILGGRP